MPNGKPGDTLTNDANSETQFAKSVAPFILCGLCLLAYLTNGGLFAAGLAFLAFFVGWSIASGRLPFSQTLEQRRDRGRKVLRGVGEGQIKELVRITEAGRKLEAIKMIRAETGDGLADAKEAVDLLADLGLHWAHSKETNN